MAKKLIAKHDKIAVKPCDEDDKRMNGIFIPDTGKEKSNLYEVVSVGPGRINEFSPGSFYRIPMETEVGDIVVLKKAVLNSIMIGREEFFTCREVEVEGVVVETEDQ